MTVRELIAVLSKMPPAATAAVDIFEEYSVPVSFVDYDVEIDCVIIRPIERGE